MNWAFPMSLRHRNRKDSGILRSRRRRLLAEPLEDRRLLAVSFEFSYVGGSSIGFNDPSEGDTYRAALEAAATRLGGWMLHDATIQLDVESKAFTGAAVAKATSEPSPDPIGGGFVHGVIPSKILGRADSNGTDADGRLEVFFFGGGDIFTYATDPSEAGADDVIDFQAVIIHELVHTLGFTSAANADGSDDSGNGLTTPGTWTVFDQFLSDVDGNRLIDGDSNSLTAFQMDVSASGWPTHSTGGKGPSAGLFFDGPIATAVHGGRVPLYSPATFGLESSISHLDSEGFPGESSAFSPLTHLMSHATVDNTVPQELTLVEKAILADIGIMLQEDVPPSITAPANITIEGNTVGGFLGLNQDLEDFLDAAVATDMIDPNPTIANNKPAFLALDQNTITFSATDASGNVATATSIVTVVDTTAPDFTLPDEVTIDSNLPAGADLTNSHLIDLITTSSSDLVDPSLSISAQPTTFPIGTTSATFTVTDDSGNAAIATTSLTVIDVSFVVTTLDDELDADPESDLSDLSLREAISLANADIGPDSIRFDPALSGSVMLDQALGELEITDSLTLTGLGRDVITIDGQDNSRVIDITDAAGDVTIESLTITGGRSTLESEGGAGIRSQSPGVLTVGFSTIMNNSTTGEGSAGAGIQTTAGDLVITNTLISGNQTNGVSAAGGGVWTVANSVIILRSSFTDNGTFSDSAQGGGLYAQNAATTITESTFSSNFTEGNSAGGGGIAFLNANATITGSTIWGNTTEETGSPGGGIHSSLTPLNLVNSTVSGNTATASGGGGIYAASGDLDIDNSTITNNDAGAVGGGIGVPATTPSLSLTIQNSIVADNIDIGAAPDFPGTDVLADAAAVGFSLIGDNTGTTLSESQTADPTTGNLVGDPNLGGKIDPLLGLLADNGGPTQTHLLLEGSPAIDAGDPLFDATAFSPPLINDQRGFPRLRGSHLDIGSVEIDSEIKITWANPADIVFGTVLGDEQLNATTTVAGTFEYSPAAGEILNAGEAQILTTTFTPDDLASYSPTMATVFITVAKADPVITWDQPDAIVFGTALDDTQLNAESVVPGTFDYAPPAGTVLDAGEDRVLSVFFAPIDTSNFNSASASVFIDVTTADPIVSWNDPADIDTVTPLGSQQLNATANVPGSFSYIPPAGVLLAAGLKQTLSVTFTPESPNFDAITKTVTIDVSKANPVIDWDDPADIVVGTAIGPAQLNAATTVAGTFSYDPVSGTVLGVGDDQVLSATFTPDNLAKFNIVTETVTIDVVGAQDFGDAPSDYPVLLGADGARHTTTTLTLGSQVDDDIDGQPSDLADGDGDDDDGVFVIADLVAVSDADTSSSFTVEVSAAGKLDAWIDFNSDGDWDDAREQILTSVDVVEGQNTLGYTIPAGATAGSTAARFRLSTAGGLAPTGSASDGEVEDYLLSVMDGGSIPNVEVDLVNGSVQVSVESDNLVVRSGPTVLFRSPIPNLGSLSILGSAIAESVTIDVGSGFAIPVGGLQLAGGAGGNTLVIVGDEGAIDLTDPSIAASDFRYLDLSSTDANTVTIDAAAVARLSPALKALSITAGQDDRIMVADVAAWRLGNPLTDGSKFVVTASNIAGGNEMIEAEVPHPWQNFIRAGDVNNDGALTAGDALRIINELGRREFSDGVTQNLEDPLSVESWPGVYFDHNGDDRATALDALRVINELARLDIETESSEGEEIITALNGPKGSAGSEPVPAEESTIETQLPLTTGRFGVETTVMNSSPAEVVVRQGYNAAETARAVDQLLSDESLVDLF